MKLDASKIFLAVLFLAIGGVVTFPILIIAGIIAFIVALMNDIKK